MSALVYAEKWLFSTRESLEDSGATVLFDRTADDRINPSCVINVRRDNLEADLVIWESGEAELSIANGDDSVEQIHFEQLDHPEKLMRVLSKILDLFGQSAPT